KIRVLEFKTDSSTDCIENLKKELELIKKEKEGLDSKLAGFQTASKELDNLLESQRLDKSKERLGYSAVPPPPAQVYSPSKKDLNPSLRSGSWFSPKSFIKFVKANDSPTKSKTDKVETAKKPPVKYAEQYKKPTKKPNVRGNQRNWNNLKSHQFGLNFVMEKKACFNCGDFNHLAYDCSKRETYPTFLIMSHLMEDMCLLVKDDVRLLATELSKQHNMYSIDLNNIVPHKDLTCLVAKASVDEVTDDFSRFTWTFFLKAKDETSGILRKFITEIENLKDLKVKII
nr:putative ribonuclease H-like domain-containing protein [Tanacetum cinerariifolium]